MAAEDAVVINVRTVGGAQAKRSIDDVAKSIGAVKDAQGRWRKENGRFISVQRQQELGLRETRREVDRFSGSLGIAGKGLQNLRNNLNLGSTAAYALRRTAYVAGASVAGLGVLSIRSGIQFNATMEQNQVAFRNFTGSTQAAQKELAYLYKTAAVTPFETTQITQAARQMMAFGFTTRDTNKWLTTVADTISGIGGGAGEIDQLVRAIGQIKSKGRLQGDELMQLSELGVLNRQDLAKRLGVSPAALSSGTLNISADQALPAIQAQFASKFGGMSAQQAKTFSGQVSTLHDNVSMALGTATTPLFNTLKTQLIPQLNVASGEINKILGNDSLSGSMKWGMTKDVLRRRLGPLADELGDTIQRADIPGHVGDAFGQAIPLIAGKMAEAGPRAAGAFVRAWLHSGPWGMFLSTAWLAQKTGAFGALFKLARGGGAGGVAGMVAGRGSPTNPMYVIALDGIGGGVPGIPGGGKAGKGGKLARAGRGALPWLGPIGAGAAAGLAFSQTGLFSDVQDSGPLHTIRGLLGTDGHRQTKAEIAASRQRAIAMADRNGARVSRGQQAIHVHSTLKVDGKTLAQSTATAVDDARARRGR